MMKRYLYMLCACVLALSACNRDDEDVHATYADANWFVIPDKPGEFNQLVYEIFRETGMPIFVNDTLGEEYYATDAQGNALFRTESFNIWYSLFGDMEKTDTQKGDCYTVQSADTVAMIKAATVIREQVIPRLPKTGEWRPKCYFMVDSINDKMTVWIGFDVNKLNVNNIACYAALKGVAVGQLCDIEKMGEKELALWAGRILAPKIAEWILDTYNSEEGLQMFYDITDEGAPYRSGWYKQTYEESNAIYQSDMLEKAGMFGWYAEGPFVTNYKNTRVRTTYSQEGDISEYVARVYAYRGREDDFKQEYKAYDKVLKKFEIIRLYVAEYEVKFQVTAD